MAGNELTNMRLKRTLPKNRNLEQIKNHYVVEKAIAERLKKSSHEERKRIYATMYDELFSQVQDHPRLTRREDEQLTKRVNKNKLAILDRFIDKSTIFAEFAPGDCRFAIEVANRVKLSYGIDISDQRNPNDNVPVNFRLIVYDGYSIEEIKDNSIDVLFSDQLIEHLHPEDTKSHFELVRRILKLGGKYVFRTPHAFTGPHDVSKYFCDEPEGFHLKEWTNIELMQLLKEIGYSKVLLYWSAKGINIRLLYSYFKLCEKVIGLFPKRIRRVISKYAMPTILCVGVK